MCELVCLIYEPTCHIVAIHSAASRGQRAAVLHWCTGSARRVLVHTARCVQSAATTEPCAAPVPGPSSSLTVPVGCQAHTARGCPTRPGSAPPSVPPRDRGWWSRDGHGCPVPDRRSDALLTLATERPGRGPRYNGQGLGLNTRNGMFSVG